MVGMWMAPRTNSNCITPGWSVGIICYGPGLTVTVALTIVSWYWNEGVPSSRASCISLVPMVLIRPGAALLSIGSRLWLPLELDIFLRSHQMILDSFVVCRV